MATLAQIIAGTVLLYAGVEVTRRSSKRQRRSWGEQRLGSYQAWSQGIFAGLVLAALGAAVIVSAVR